MNKELPEFKNEVDKINVPTEKLDFIIANTIKENKVKKPKRKIALYSVSAAVLGIGLFIGSAIASPAMAKVASHIPLIGTFFNDSNDEGLRIAGQKGLTQIVDQSTKDNGITLTMNEVFYDGTRLTFGYTQEALLAIGQLERPTIEVNGKEINFSSGSSGDFITPLKYKGTMDITPTEELPEEFELKMRIDAVGLIPGKWEFAFSVKQSNEVTVIRPKEVTSIEGGEMEISTLKLGPAGVSLAVQVTADQNKLDVYGIHFFIVDEKGNVLDVLSASGNGEEENGIETAKLNILFSPLKEGMKKVKIIPYTIPNYSDTRKEEGLKLAEQELPIVMDQGESGKVIIDKIENIGKKTVIYYQVENDFIVDNYTSHNPIWLEDSKGNNLFSEDNPLPERIEGNYFKQEFTTSNKKDIMLKTVKQPKPIMYKAFEIEIP